MPTAHRPQRPPQILTNTDDADVNCHESRYSEGRSDEGRFGEGHEGDDYESYAWADDCDDVPAGAAAAAAGAIIAFAVLSSLCCCVPCIVAAVICCCIAQASQRRQEQALAAPPAPGGLHYGHPVRPLLEPRMKPRFTVILPGRLLRVAAVDIERIFRFQLTADSVMELPSKPRRH